MALLITFAEDKVTVEECWILALNVVSSWSKRIMVKKNTDRQRDLEKARTNQESIQKS